jgi:hypothetical protein
VADPLQALLDAGLIPQTSFPPTSRYARVGVAVHEGVPYLRRRLSPRPERLALLYEVTVVEGDRRDLLAARHLGAAELWWRLADATGVVDPRDLTAVVGRTVRVALEEGVPGA